VAGHPKAKLIFADKVDKNICKMIELGVDLRPYLISNVHLLYIKDHAFPKYHHDPEVKYIPLGAK